MVNKLSIAHCSDIHLGANNRNDEVTRDIFSLALNKMCEHSPDLLIIAGDLFDSNSVSYETVEWTKRVLSELSFNVVIIPGNHDCLEEGAIFRIFDFSLMSNIYVLTAAGGELVKFDELKLAVWGKGIIHHDAKYRPLDGCPEKPIDCEWYIGLGHGLFVPRGEETHRASPIYMDQIDTSPCDYLALGHHHAAKQISNDYAAAAYSGSPTDNIGGYPSYIIVNFVSGEKPNLNIYSLPKIK
jgi:DNA repair exonuclease SbcCD nuclease subunit|tara:strand:+ start:7093 stop:7815 length:723 start_codon:yes stop_codon:yes gene_type:complete